MDLATRLLVVDDDPGIRELTAGFLSQHGYVVDTAADGAELRRRLAREHHALVVLDVMMPGEDGLSILRSLDRATSPAVIVLSVIGEEVDRIVGLSSDGVFGDNTAAQDTAMTPAFTGSASAGYAASAVIGIAPRVGPARGRWLGDTPLGVSPSTVVAFRRGLGTLL